MLPCFLPQALSGEFLPIIGLFKPCGGARLGSSWLLEVQKVTNHLESGQAPPPPMEECTVCNKKACLILDVTRKFALDHHPSK